MSAAHFPPLTKFSTRGGCGCKIAAQDLEEILDFPRQAKNIEKLLVGFETKDDAAVYDIGNGQGVVSTTDFFAPIVDDAYDFGRISATNAISDIYAMGAKPLLAIAIFGWPTSSLSKAQAKCVLQGAESVCASAGIPLSGGHSIDASEPFFGLAVTGLTSLNNVKRNNTATNGCLLYLTKPIGVGILALAHRKGILKDHEYKELIQITTTLNSIGLKLATCPAVKALTDVTGFGFLGHLLEMCGKNMTVSIGLDLVPSLPSANSYKNEIMTGGGMRNFKHVKSYVQRCRGTPLSSGSKETLVESDCELLCDPQTSGGLFIAVDPRHPSFSQFQEILSEEKLAHLKPCGIFEQSASKEKITIYDTLCFSL